MLQRWQEQETVKYQEQTERLLEFKRHQIPKRNGKKTKANLGTKLNANRTVKTTAV
jgi:hypothetical protein